MFVFASHKQTLSYYEAQRTIALYLWSMRDYTLLWLTDNTTADLCNRTQGKAHGLTYIIYLYYMQK